MIIAIVAEKGGTGKTTLATNLAGMRASSGRRTLLIDADRQGSSNFWAEIRARLSLPSVDGDVVHGEALGRRLRNPPTRYDDIIVDTGAGDSLELEAVLSTSDCAIAPLQPSGVDVWTMGLVDSRIEQALGANPGLQAWALLNRVSTNPNSLDEAEARAALADCAALIVPDVRICQRVAFHRALTEGRTVPEYARSGDRSRDEIAAVYELVFGQPYKG